MKRVGGDGGDTTDGRGLLITRKLLKVVSYPENPAYMLIRHKICF